MPVKKSSRSEEAENDRSWELEEIQQLIDLLIKREVAEFELEKNGMRIRILRQASPGPESASVVNSSGDSASQPADPVSAPAAPAPSQESAATESQPAAPSEDAHVLKSPMVGTFFASPSPDAPPFVAVGDRVSVGQVLCIVEAMKLMNEIESEVEGRVMKILVESTKPVEYGQALFLIDPKATP